MDKERMIFWRNFLVTVLLVTIALTIIVLLLTFCFWDFWLNWITNSFPFSREMITNAVLTMLIDMRLFIWLILICPAIALHIMIKRKK